MFFSNLMIRFLLRRLGSTGGTLTVAALVDAEVAHAGAEEGERVTSAGCGVRRTVSSRSSAASIAAVGVARSATSSGRIALVEGLLSTRVKAASLRWHAAAATHLRVSARHVRAGLGTDSRRERISGGGTVRLAAKVARRATHSTATVLAVLLVHAAVGLSAHRGAHRHVRGRTAVVVPGKCGHTAFSDDGSLAARGATAQAARVLGEVVVLATLVATLPVTSTERNRSTTPATGAAHVTTHATVTMAMAVSMAVSTMSAHHARVTVAGLATIGVRRHAVALAVWVRLSSHGREGATEACCATLEVGEAAAGASPVTGTWAVLRRREWGEERWATGRLGAGSTVEDARR